MVNSCCIKCAKPIPFLRTNYRRSISRAAGWLFIKVRGCVEVLQSESRGSIMSLVSSGRVCSFRISIRSICAIVIPPLIFIVGSLCPSSEGTNDAFTLDSIRQSLVRQEDTIIFSLIERAKFPINSAAYDASPSSLVHGFPGSLLDFVVRRTEAVQAKAGRYENPEELPFLLITLPHPLVPRHNYPQVLYPAAASVNVSKTILDMYIQQLLPLFTAKGDDGNYASAAACDLACLQALSRRIHDGRFVAEVKFRDAPKDYEPLIRAKDRDALMKLLTDEKVEEMVKERVRKKAMIFGQEVSLNDTDSKGKYKVDPSVVSHLYAEWVIPLTKLIEVEYLLRRLD